MYWCNCAKENDTKDDLESILINRYKNHGPVPPLTTGNILCDRWLLVLGLGLLSPQYLPPGQGHTLGLGTAISHIQMNLDHSRDISNCPGL